MARKVSELQRNDPMFFANSVVLVIILKDYGTERKVYRLFPRRLVSPTICSLITKAALSPHYLKTLSIGLVATSRPESSPMLNLLSQPGAGESFNFTSINNQFVSTKTLGIQTQVW